MLDVNIKKSYNSFQLNIEFQANPGITGILGPSGCGKSLTLQSLAGIMKPDKGKITMNQQTWYDSGRTFWKPQQRKVGYLFQNYALFPHLTVEQNIAYGLKGMLKHEKNQRVEKWLKTIQLETYKDRHPSKLSGGQQQRVALARSMITEPQLLLLDEPFSALDQHIRHSLEEDLRRIIDETFHGVVLLVTHNIEEAFRMCNSIMLLNEGEVIQKGDRRDVLKIPASKKAAEIVGCENVFKVSSWEKEGLSIKVNTHGHIFQLKKQKVENLAHIGIRSDDVRITTWKGTDDNCFPGEILHITEGVKSFKHTVRVGSLSVHIEEVNQEEANLRWKVGDRCYVTFPQEKLICMEK
ncbi:hypothetical protein CR194_17625 [Salipaludibacillus keqinensis]|uniref:ABC transporter domain-containing protein n=1 Tax=Salipaludibacillus keqinensis TaxID=2045207 RepID=A0A323TAN0_9BACI|nr:ABC transporter ATP-binding protein [Salipaludibacillus keqinensis]PYZ92016.1 hypothetical protein CR194_17625 [Salipaludibacillus keqinensis]